MATRQPGNEGAAQCAVTGLPRGRVTRRPRGADATAFTLVEMLVSIAVLSVALVVIGFVFAATVKTTRQAAAYSEANNWVRQFLDQIDEDLKSCEPSQSVMVMVGRTQAAALTREKLAANRYYRVLTGNPNAQGLAGYNPETNPNLDSSTNGPQYSNPRADILMFITNRQTASQAPPQNPLTGTFGEACLNGARFAPIEVVYGDAAFNDPEYNPSSGQFQWPPDDSKARHIEQTVDGSNKPNALSVIPANRWHLARRATILSLPDVYVPPPPPPAPNYVLRSLASCQRIARCQASDSSATEPNMPGDGTSFDLPYFLRTLGPNYFTTNNAPYLSPYYWPDNNPYGKWQAQNVNSINTLLYSSFNGYPGNPAFHHVATVIDNPPAELQSNIGVHMLPSCAWFQVEFLMPEDPRNGIDYTPDPNSGEGQRTDMPRWTQVDDGKTYVFIPDTQANRAVVSAEVANGVPLPQTRLDSFAWVIPPSPPAPPGKGGINSVANRRIRMWPYAIRVTVRVFDPEDRLPQPIVRSIVHRFD